MFNNGRIHGKSVRLGETRTVGIFAALLSNAVPKRHPAELCERIGARRNETSVLRHHSLHLFLVNVEIREHMLHVVVFLERFDQPQHLPCLRAG